jgi:hypothetical protein
VRRKRRGWILVAVLVVLINLPLVHSTITEWRVDRSGVPVTAEVAENEVTGSDDDPSFWLGIRFPEEIDPDQGAWPVQVDRETYETAVESGEIEARVLESNPAAFRVEGEQRSRLGLITTVIADAILLLILLVIRRFGRREEPEPLLMVATGDVERCPPGGFVEQLDGSLYLVRGEVVGMEDGEVVLDVGDRDVVVTLDGHQNPVGYQQPAQVRGRVVD